MVKFWANGKQVLCDGKHYADCISEEGAAAIVTAMNACHVILPAAIASIRTFATNVPIGSVVSKRLSQLASNMERELGC